MKLFLEPFYSISKLPKNIHAMIFENFGFFVTWPCEECFLFQKFERTAAEKTEVEDVLQGRDIFLICEAKSPVKARKIPEIRADFSWSLNGQKVTVR